MSKVKRDLVELRDGIADELHACRAGIRRSKNELQGLRQKKYKDLNEATQVDQEINIVAQQLAQLQEIESKLEDQLTRANSELLKLQFEKTIN